MSRWFRFYEESLNDPKVQRLPGDTFKSWVNLLCLASKDENGVLPSLPDIAFALRLSDDEASTLLNHLYRLQLLDEVGVPDAPMSYTPHNWKGRQYKSDNTDPTAPKRQKAYRERNKDSNGDRNATVTETATRADTEQSRTEQKDAREGNRLGDFCQAIVAAYAEGNSPTLPDTSRAGLWLQQGFDPEICLAVIREIVRKKPNASLAYFDKPIREAHESKAPPRASIAPPKDDGSVEVLDQYALEAWDAHRMKTEGKTYPRNKKGGWRFPSKFPPGHEAVLIAGVERIVAQRSQQ